MVVLSLLACGKSEAPVAEAVRPVRTWVVQPQQVDAVGAFPGEVRPQVESPLGFRVSGKLIERLVQQGDDVMAGQLLARLDPQDLQLAESAARAQLSAAEVEAARTRGDFQRFSRLRESGFISSAEFDARKAAYDAAQASVEQARANLASRRNQSEYTALRADADGVVTGVDAEVGQVVSAGQPVVRVAQNKAKEVAFQLPESLVDTVRRIGVAKVDLWSGPSGMRAELTEVAGRADPLTRVFAARVLLRDPPPSVRFGMSATVRFQQGLSEPLVPVPLAALWREDGRTRVWVFDPEGGKVRSEPVDVVTVSDTQALLRTSLPPGAEIVTAGVHRLTEGQAVKRIGADLPAAGAPAGGAMLPLAQPGGRSPAPLAASSVPDPRR
ncbi:MAG: efflux RND transporter periplasmic adaptor subunit [Pigmentiphaga sp.]|nr:efflux RND transporter periplasmic adaptor subunit [Pigmentiphaga sp.]